MTIDLAVRPIAERDLRACVHLLTGRLAYPEQAVRELPGIWRRLLHEEAMNAVVFENRDRSGRAVMVSFAASVFVSDAWVAAARCSLEPYLTVRTLLSDRGSDDSPILRPDAIGRENGAGLNVLNLHYIEARDLTPDLTRPLRYLVMHAFQESHRGYRIKEVLQELWDELDPEFVLHGWGRVRCDFAAYFEARGEAVPSPGRRPYLIGLTREEALEDPGDLIAPVFTFTPAQFCFSRAEKRVLRRALLGRTDTQLAHELGLALPTVKSHWSAVYNRVARITPELLPEAPRETALGTSRGQEKRRRLLDYLRRHPEELCSGLDSSHPL